MVSRSFLWIIRPFSEHVRSWYRRDELGTRIAVFSSSVAIAGAFGGLLAVCLRLFSPICRTAHGSALQAAISNMDGIGGKPAW